MFGFGDEDRSELLGRGTGGTGVESSLLSESLALKAFLRIKREERKRNSSTDLLMQPSPSPFSKDRSHFSLSYDPDIDSTPLNQSQPTRERFAFDEMTNESEERKGTPTFTKASSTFASSGGEERSQPHQSRSFNSMHAIINETFQEKIDYQRKLREQQSELLALKDKLHHLQIENLRLTQTTIKLNQRQLPLAFAQVMKIRRRTKVSQSLGFPPLPPLSHQSTLQSHSFNLLFANGSNATTT
jgi:hypothetical protein